MDMMNSMTRLEGEVQEKVIEKVERVAGEGMMN